MRFTLAALFIGLVAAGRKPQDESVIISHKEMTVTRCPPEVTDCPFESKTVHVSTSVIVDTTTYCPEEASATAKPSSYKQPPPPKSETPCTDNICVVTMTRPYPSASASASLSAVPYPKPNNTTKPVPVVASTGSPTTPTGSYYSNAASSLSGGMLAIGAGALAMLAL